jgi:hypothetical protein
MASDIGAKRFFDTQINASALIAEINLLLDFISGRSDRTLGGGQQLRMPDQYTDYGAMLNTFFDIRSRASQSPAASNTQLPPSASVAHGNAAVEAADLRFLVEFRDYLNSAASPASGSTIAFSTLVSDRAAGHRMIDARLAYPGYSTLAWRLRAFVVGMCAVSLLVTVLVALMGAYVYWGNAIVVSDSSAITEQDELAKDIAREEASGITRLNADDYQTAMTGSLFLPQIVHISGTNAALAGPAATSFAGFLGLCDAITQSSYSGRTVRVFLSSTQEYLCGRSADIQSELADFQTEIKAWFGFEHHLLPFQSKTMRNPALLMKVAPHLISVVNGYAIPLAMGFLGSAAFILRVFLERLGNRVLTTRDLLSNSVRLVLGFLSGLAVGFFLSPSAGSGAAADSLGLGISLTAPALAFLAGYAVDILFRFLDTLAGRAFTVK